MSRGPGAGADDPLPESRRVTDRAVVFDDSPGFSVLGHPGHTWVHVVQNFTCWVEGRPRAGGATRRLTEVLAWHSVISVVKVVDEDQYRATPLTRSGTGWVPTDPPNV